MPLAMTRVRTGLAGLICLLALPSCGWFFGGGRTSAPDPSEATYRAAMADFSTCAAPSSPQDRAAAAARLEEAAGIMQANARPTNADHFYMTDRVVAARDFCNAAVNGAPAN